MQPRKSRALIITFIITLIILIVGYLLLFKSGALKGDSSILGKKFDPILGTPKPKDVIVGTDDVTGTPKTTITTSTTPILPSNQTKGGGIVNPGQQVVPNYTPPNLSFPQPVVKQRLTHSTPVDTQCNDGKDNDGDGSIDSFDDDCHYDGNANNAASYVDTYNSEFGSKNTAVVVSTKKVISCDIEEIPLTFTAAEQARLDELTRQFYRLSPQLKTENDIVSEVSSDQGYHDIIDNANTLEKECRDQTSTPQYLKNDIDRIVGDIYTIKSGLTFAPGQSCKTNPDMCEEKGRELFSGYTPDYLGAEAAKKILGIDNMKYVNCFDNPGLCHPWKFTYTKLEGNTPDVNESTLNKGRRERLPNPYYDSSREQFPFDETASYVLQYFVDPRHREKIFPAWFAPPINDNWSVYMPNPPTAANPYVWIYREKERSWKVW